MSKKAIVPNVLSKAVGTYAQIMVRISEYAVYARKYDELRENLSLKKTPPTDEERKRAFGEYNILKGYEVGRKVGRTRPCNMAAGRSREQIEDAERREAAKRKEWILERILNNRIAAQLPPPPREDEKEIGLPLGVAMSEGGDPFPDEWEELRGALAKVNLPEMRGEAKMRHDSFVTLFPMDATDYGWKAIEKAARALASLFDGLPSLGKEDCRMTIKAFAKLCGRSIRTVKNWNAGKGRIPTVFNPVLKEDVTYSPELLDNPIEAERFAMLYKEHRRIKKAEREKISYRGEETDRMNERQKRGIPPSTEQRESDYYGIARDSDSAARLGYKSHAPSSWGT